MKRIPSLRGIKGIKECQRNLLTILNNNIRSLRHKLDEIETFLAGKDIDTIIMTYV